METQNETEQGGEKWVKAACKLMVNTGDGRPENESTVICEWKRLMDSPTKAPEMSRVQKQLWTEDGAREIETGTIRVRRVE